MAVMVIDVGSSSVRALLLDDHLRVIPGALARHDYQFAFHPEGAAVFDAHWLRERLESCIDALLLHPAAAHISAVGMTTLVGNLLGVDAHNQPLTPVYTYADTRAAPLLPTLKNSVDTNAAYQRTGCPLHTAYHPARLAWLHSMDADQFERVAIWLDFATYCYRCWFDAPVPSSYSVASWSGLLERHSLTWDRGWLDWLDLDAERLPSLADYQQVQVGLNLRCRSRWSALAHVPFYLAVGDGAAANVGSGGTNENCLALTVGTTAAVRMVSTTPPEHVPSGLWHYRVDANHHLIGGATTEGGNIFSWAAQTLHLDAAEVETLLRQRPADSHGLTVLPLFAGERSPGYAADAVGTLHGLRLSTTPIDILQALLEGVALRLALIADLISESPAPVYAGGGALYASPVWAEIIANAFNRPLSLIDEPEPAARGVALLIGGMRDSAEKPQIRQVIHPDPAAAAALQAARARQRALYQQFYGGGL